MIEKGKTVKIHYTLTVDENVVDSSQGKEPLQYVQGEGMIISGLENELAGLKAGDTKNVVVAPEQAYGVVNDKAIVDVPRSNFQLGENEPQLGMGVQATAPDGQPLNGRIVAVTEENLKVDFNHPLAGKELSFAVEVVEVS